VENEKGDAAAEDAAPNKAARKSHDREIRLDGYMSAPVCACGQLM
jgi:hypothetical protein